MGLNRTPEQTLLSSTRLPLVVLLYLLAVVTPVFINIGGLNFTAPRLYIIVMLFPICWGFAKKMYGEINLVDIFFTLHFLWMIVALSVNNPSMVVSQTGSVGFEFLGGYFLGRCFIRTPEAFKGLCRWVVLLVVCTMPFAVFETLTGRPIIIEIFDKLPGISSYGEVSNPPRLGLERAQVIFDHPIHYGLFCSIAFSLAFVALKNVAPWIWRYTASGIIVLSCLLALSSGAFLAIFIQIALVLWSIIFEKIHRRWWLLLALGCFGYIIVEIISNRPAVVAVLTRLTFSADNVYARVMIFEWGIRNVWSNPVFGIGYNDWVRPPYLISGSVDNFWLLMGMRYGIPGFLFVVLGYAIGVFYVMRRNFDSGSVINNFRLAWVFSVIGLSFTLSTVHVWTNIYSFVFFLFGSGMWLMTTEPGSSKLVMNETGDENKSRALPYTRFSKVRVGSNTSRHSQGD